MFPFLWVYGFPLGLWFSFGFMVFLWVYVFPLGICYSYVLSGLGIRLFGVEEKRCALHKGPWRYRGRKRCFSHHCHSAWLRTERQLVNGDTGMMEIDRGMGANGDTVVMEID